MYLLSIPDLSERLLHGTLASFVGFYVGLEQAHPTLSHSQFMFPSLYMKCFTKFNKLIYTLGDFLQANLNLEYFK